MSRGIPDVEPSASRPVVASTRDELARALNLSDLPGWTAGRLWERSLPGLYDELAAR